MVADYSGVLPASYSESDGRKSKTIEEHEVHSEVWSAVGNDDRQAVLYINPSTIKCILEVEFVGKLISTYFDLQGPGTSLWVRGCYDSSIYILWYSL